MNATAPAPAPTQGQEDLVTLSIIDWELGVVDRNCRKLLRVLAGIEQMYAGTSNETPGGRAHLKKQLDGLQLEKADYRERREALLQKLSRQPASAAALAASIRLEEGEEKIALPDDDPGRNAPVVEYLRFPATGEEDSINLPEPSTPYATVVGPVVPLSASATIPEHSTPPAAAVEQIVGADNDGDGALVDATGGCPPTFPSSSCSITRSMVADIPAAAGDTAAAAALDVEVAADTVSTRETEISTVTSSAAANPLVPPTSVSVASGFPAKPPGSAEVVVAETVAAAAPGEEEEEEEAKEAATMTDYLCGPAPTVKGSSAQPSTPNLEPDCSASSQLALLSSFSGGTAARDVREPITHEVKVRATVGARGLGLILGEENKGSRWVVKGFRPMPGGKPNPGQAAGIKAGDQLQQLGGVVLGSHKEGTELLKQQRGPVFITVRRQTF